MFVNVRVQLYVAIQQQQLYEDTGCSPGHQPEAMNDREEWLERVRDIRAGGMTR